MSIETESKCPECGEWSLDGEYCYNCLDKFDEIIDCKYQQLAEIEKRARREFLCLKARVIFIENKMNIS